MSDEAFAAEQAASMGLETTLSPAALVAGCRAMHDCQGTGEPDSLIHHPAQKSWEEPTEPRWSQWIETVIEVHGAILAAQPALGEREISEPPFAWRPGQALTVVQTDEPGHWSMDWKPDQIVYFAGWSWDVRKVRADVWVSDQWPPKSPGDLTDGWDPLDLTAALSTTTSTEGAA